jgi:hypothetical protein
VPKRDVVESKYHIQVVIPLWRHELSNLALKNIHESVFWEEDDHKWNMTGLGESNLLDNDCECGFPSNIWQSQGFHPVRLDVDSYIFSFNGWRGSGKTTSLTYFAMRANYLYNMRLISNYPIEYRLVRINGTSKIIKSELLDLYKLLCFDADYKNCLILIDEAPDIISHMASTSWKNRLVNIFIRQLRKNRNSLMVSAQQFELLDKSFRWQTDVLINCEDLSRKYGIEGMPRGATILLNVLDHSGCWTGRSWEEEIEYNKAHGIYKDIGEKMELAPMVLWGDDSHKPVFDTYYQQDIWESLKKVDMNLQSFQVGKKEIESPEDLTTFSVAVNFIENLKSSDNKRVKTTDFFAHLGPITAREKDFIGKKLSSSDVRVIQEASGKRFYDFTDFDLNKFVRN